MRWVNGARIVSISGVDGAGKTTIIKTLRAELARSGVPTSYVWLRYNHYFTKFLLGFCRVAGLTRYESVGGIRVGYHEFRQSPAISWAFIFLTAFDTLMASVVKVYLPAMMGRSLIICDRWITDILVDLEVDTGIDLVKRGWVRRAFEAMVPRGARRVVIVRDPQKISEVRPECAADRNFLLRNDLFRKHASGHDILAIENDGELQQAVDAIKAAVKAG